MSTFLLLQSIGLTEGEAKVYQELIKMGQVTKTPIALKSKVSSSKVYEILERLAQKGLVSTMIKNNTKHFQAAPPEKLRSYLKKKEHDLLKEKEIAKTLIPVLNQQFKEQQAPFTTRLYEGMEGLRTAADELLVGTTSKSVLYAMGITGNKPNHFNNLWVHWHKKRVKKKIRCKLLFSDSQNSEWIKYWENSPYTECRFLQLITPSAITIMENKAAIFDYREKPICLLIENNNIVLSFKQFFESLWKIGK